MINTKPSSQTQEYINFTPGQSLFHGSNYPAPSSFVSLLVQGKLSACKFVQSGFYEVLVTLQRVICLMMSFRCSGYQVFLLCVEWISHAILSCSLQNCAAYPTARISACLNWGSATFWISTEQSIVRFTFFTTNTRWQGPATWQPLPSAGQWHLHGVVMTKMQLCYSITFPVLKVSDLRGQQEE